MLAFFLHPAYKGNGIKYGQFHNIVSHAGSIWKSLGKNRESWESLSTQLHLYKLQRDDNGVPNAYSAPYTPNQDTVMSWWNTCEANPKHLQQLALRIFSITPSSASCERMFSTLGWLYGKKRQNLSIHKLESLAKVYRYNISEVAQTTNHLKRNKVEMTQDEIQDLLNKSMEEEEEEEGGDDEDDVVENEISIATEESNIPDCELDVQVVIEFNSCVFEMFNESNVIEELDGGFFDEETGGDDYDPIEVAHELMSFEDYNNV